MESGRLGHRISLFVTVLVRLQGGGWRSRCFQPRFTSSSPTKWLMLGLQVIFANSADVKQDILQLGALLLAFQRLFRSDKGLFGPQNGTRVAQEWWRKAPEGSTDGAGRAGACVATSTQRPLSSESLDVRREFTEELETWLGWAPRRGKACEKMLKPCTWTARTSMFRCFSARFAVLSVNFSRLLSVLGGVFPSS